MREFDESCFFEIVPQKIGDREWYFPWCRTHYSVPVAPFSTRTIASKYFRCDGGKYRRFLITDEESSPSITDMSNLAEHAAHVMEDSIYGFRERPEAFLYEIDASDPANPVLDKLRIDLMTISDWSDDDFRNYHFSIFNSNEDAVTDFVVTIDGRA